jgi:hypothetical protein
MKLKASDLHTCLFGLAILATLPSARSYAFEPTALQKQFASARELQLVNAASTLPPDVREKLDHIPWLHRLGLAEFGGDWAAGDAPEANRPLGRHLFSGISTEIAAVVFQTHGQASHIRLLLAPRNSSEYCLFELPSQNIASVRLSEIQFLLRPPRASEPNRDAPRCHSQSTTKEFQPQQ